MLTRKLFAVVCAAAAAAASITLIATHVTAQSQQQAVANIGDCARVNQDVTTLGACSNFSGFTGACSAKDGRAFRVTGWESDGYYGVRHVLASGYVEWSKLDWAPESYCVAAGIR
jgi:hypothetical protein